MGEKCSRLRPCFFNIVAPLIKIAITLAVVAVVSALLAPPVYWLIQEVGVGIFPWLESIPFHRVFSRVLFVCFLLAMGPLLIGLKISSFREVGLDKNYQWERDFTWGLLSSLLPVALLMTVYVQFDVCRVREGGIEFVSILRVIGTTLGVSILEEAIFRGLLYGLSRRVMGAFFSTLWTSIIFAIVHFLRSSDLSPDPVDAWSGFREFGHLFSSVPPLPTFLFALATLISIGLLLCWAVEQTHSLALPIGLHAGWIFGIQTFNLFTKFRIKPPGMLPWVAPNVISGTVPLGIFAILAVALTFLICWKYLHGVPRKKTPMERGT